MRRHGRKLSWLPAATVLLLCYAICADGFFAYENDVVKRRKFSCEKGRREKTMSFYVLKKLCCFPSLVKSLKLAWVVFFLFLLCDSNILRWCCCCVCVCVYTLWNIWVSSFLSPPPLGIASHAQSSTTYIYHLSLFARIKSFTSFSFFFFCCGSDNDDMKTRANIHPKSLILFYLFIYFRWREPSLAIREQRRRCRCCVGMGRCETRTQNRFSFGSSTRGAKEALNGIGAHSLLLLVGEVNKKEIHTATTKDDDDDDDEWHCWELRKLWKFLVLRSSDGKTNFISRLFFPPLPSHFTFFAPIFQAVWLVHWVSFERGKLAFLPISLMLLLLFSAENIFHNFTFSRQQQLPDRHYGP